MVLNVTSNNISDIPWRSVLLLEEIRMPRENHQPATIHWQTLSHNVDIEYASIERDSISQR